MPVRIHRDLPKDLDVAMEAAQKASDVIQSYRKQKKSLDIQLKGRHDLVTKADLAAEEVIIKTIKEHYPDDAFLAEETAEDTTLTDQRTWIIDPIDGTTNFAHDFPTFCVSIALYVDKEPQVATVLEVSRGEMFAAVKGHGALLNGRPIHVSDCNSHDDALLGTGFPYRDLSLVDDYLKLFKRFMAETQSVRRPGSAAYDLCCVAAGRFDAFYEYGLAPWDVAAGVLIIEEAGGKVTDWTGGDDFLFGKRILASTPGLYDYMKDAIQDEMAEEHWTQG